MRVVSVFVGFHDTSAAILCGDRLAVFEYERVTGVRYDTVADAAQLTGFLRYSLLAAGLSPAELDHVVVVAQDGFPPALGTDSASGIARARELTLDGPRWRFDAFTGAARALGLPRDVWFVEHHLAHAWSAAGGLSEGVILAVDGGGSHQSSALYARSAAGVELLRPDAFDVNWGQTYRKVPGSLIEEFAGGRFELPGKIMALAGLAAADTSLTNAFAELAASGTAELTDWLTVARRHLGIADADTLPRDTTDAWVLCASLQRALELDMERLFRAAAPEALRSQGIGLAGGVALNGVNNTNLLQRFAPAQFYVPSAPGDGGLPIGGLLAVLHRLGEPLPDTRTAFLGPQLVGAEIAQSWPAEGVDTVIQRLCEGQVVGLVSGRAEVGPRALGHRSILALPESEAMKDRINRIKSREWFRPVAPVVDRRDVPLLFEQDVASPFMSQVINWSEASRARFPSGAHADGSARLQTIEPDQSGAMATILRALREAGHPVLLNTSLNGRGQAIHASLPQALAFWLKKPLDTLAVGSDERFRVLAR